MTYLRRVGSIPEWAHAIQLRRQACGRETADEGARIARAATTVARVRIGNARIKYAQVTSARSMSATANAVIVAVIIDG